MNALAVVVTHYLVEIFHGAVGQYHEPVDHPRAGSRDHFGMDGASVRAELNLAALPAKIDVQNRVVDRVQPSVHRRFDWISGGKERMSRGNLLRSDEDCMQEIETYRHFVPGLLANDQSIGPRIEAGGMLEFKPKKRMPPTELNEHGDEFVIGG